MLLTNTALVNKDLLDFTCDKQGLIDSVNKRLASDFGIAAAAKHSPQWTECVGEPFHRVEIRLHVLTEADWFDLKRDQMARESMAYDRGYGTGLKDGINSERKRIEGNLKKAVLG